MIVLFAFPSESTISVTENALAETGNKLTDLNSKMINPLVPEVNEYVGF